eukprot:15293-Heterococcus_DN1.PRE.1
MDSSLASISLPLPSLSSSWATVSMSEHSDAQSDEQLAQADAVAEDEQEQAPETTQEQLTQAAEAVAENEPEQEQERALETPSEHPINQDAAASDGKQEQQHEEPQRSSYIAEGLANVSLPLPKREPTRAAPAPQPAAPEPAVVEREVTVGDECICVFGRGKVLQIRDDGVYVVQARGWNMAHDSRAQFFLQKDALKWAAPKSVYAMSTLEQIEAAADCKTQGGELFVKGDTQSALNHYVKAITYLQHIRDDHSTNSEKAKVVMLCNALEANSGGAVMGCLRARGVSDNKIFVQWKRRALFQAGKANCMKKAYDEAVPQLQGCLKLAQGQKGAAKHSGVCCIAELASAIAQKFSLMHAFSLLQDEADIRKLLEVATRGAAKQDRKVKKMWAKAFNKNATTAPEDEQSAETQQQPAAAAAAAQKPYANGTTSSSSSTTSGSTAAAGAATARKGSASGFKMPMQDIFDKAAAASSDSSKAKLKRTDVPISDTEGAEGSWPASAVWLTLGGAVAVAAVAAVVLARRSKS